MSKRPRQDVSDSKLGSLIERLGPLNNDWRDGAPAQKVAALWAMGDVLLSSLPEPTDAALWEIQQHSYITRNVLRYALIIRRSWASQAELKRLAQGLRNYTVFREALPFLKGDRAGIDEATYKQVVTLLRSPDTQKAVRFLKELKARRIGRRHKKGASVAAMREQAVSFGAMLAQLEAEALSGMKDERVAPDAVLMSLSRAAMSIASGEEVKQAPLPDDEALRALAVPLAAVARGGRAAASAFRKAVGAAALMQAADMLNSMRSEAALAEWRRRRGAAISLAVQEDRRNS